MQTITIDEEFKSLLPALDKETYALLEENLLLNGCRDSLVLWNDILIDGHNRYKICMEHDIPFNVIYREFASRDDALIWIISTQVSRRNLTPIQLSHFRGLHYRTDKKLQGTSGQNVGNFEKVQNEPFQNSTAIRLADQYNVSRSTIKRDAKLANAIDAIGEVSPDAKMMILSGDAKLNKKELEALSSMSEYELSEIAISIEEGTYEKKKPETAASANDSIDVGSAPAVSQSYGTQPFDIVIGKIAGAFYAELQKLAKKEDVAGLKTALRSHIDMLEDLYRQI